MRPGASTAAWSLLWGLLEKDGTQRLGSRDDFVSGKDNYLSKTDMRHSV